MSKQAVILIHGGASSGRMYKDVTPILERNGFECITPDLPGHGSAAQQGPFTFAAASQTIANAVKQIQASSSSTAETPKITVVGISLGAQAVLSFLQTDVDAIHAVPSAIVSGASIHPPDDAAQWEMPRMPTEQAWLDIIMEDVKLAGWDNMPQLQATSFGFTFDLPESKKLPPVLAVVGEHDTPMSRRDLPELVEKLKGGNAGSESLVMNGAWHNHSIDVPEQFAGVIIDWVRRQ